MRFCIRIRLEFPDAGHNSKAELVVRRDSPARRQNWWNEFDRLLRQLNDTLALTNANRIRCECSLFETSETISNSKTWEPEGAITWVEKTRRVLLSAA